MEALGIYVFNYKTSLTSGNYSLSDAVDYLRERFEIEELIDNRKIIFVCHSMGGIIVRRYLVKQELADRNIEVGLFLVASPSLGAKYANWLELIAKFLGQEQAKALKFSQYNQWLNDLDVDFIDLKESGKLQIHGKELLEDESITPKIGIKPVVEHFSGHRYFGKPIKIPDSDHFSIAKPNDKKAFNHELLIKFINEVINSEQICKQKEKEDQAKDSDSPLEKKAKIAESCAILLPDNNPFYNSFREEIKKVFSKKVFGKKDIDFEVLDNKDSAKTDIENYQKSVNEFLEEKKFKWLITIYKSDQEDFFNGLLPRLHDFEVYQKKRFIFIESESYPIDCWLKEYSEEDKNSEEDICPPPPFYVFRTKYKEAAKNLVEETRTKFIKHIENEDLDLTVVFLYPNIRPAVVRAIEFQKFLSGIVRQSPVFDVDSENNNQNQTFKKINLVQLSMGDSWTPEKAFELIDNNFDFIKPLLKDKKVLMICGNDEIALSIFENLGKLGWRVGELGVIKSEVKCKISSISY